MILARRWVVFKVFRYKTRSVQGHLSRELLACVACIVYFLYGELWIIFTRPLCIVQYFPRNRQTENAHPQNNVRWQAVSEEERAEAYEEPKPSKLVASFPEELDDFVTNVIVLGDDNVQVTRASVYLEDNVDSVRDSVTDVGGSISKVNSNSNLLDMDTAVINFSETETEDEDFQVPQPKFDLSNSLDIEKELNDLMGRFQFDGEKSATPTFPNEIEEYDNVTPENAGSNINLGFVDTESDGESICSSLASGWTWQGYPTHDNQYWENQRKKSKSFVGKAKLNKLLRNGKQRMSMIEFGSKRLKRTRSNVLSPKETKDDAVFIEPKCFLRLAYDRSSVVEPRVTSVVSLPTRPNSALADKFPSCGSLETEISSAGQSSLSSLSSQNEHRRSLRISGVYDENIDWGWLEEAVRDLEHPPESQEPEQIRPTTSRVDAGCQTHSEQSWPGEEEGMRNTSLSERVYDSTAISVSSECRALEINGSCDEDMSGKHNVEGSGPSGVSSWLRQSMRRVRHFNLGEPPRIRSAPPDVLRLSVESVRSEGIANPVVTNSERVQTQSESVQQNARQQQRQQQRPRSAGNRPQRRHPPRPRPVSAPARRPLSSTGHLQIDVGNSQPVTNPVESQDNLGYESDSTDRHPSPRRRRRRLEDDGNEDCEGRSPLGPWPHGLSSVLAGLGCTLGLFNISRFAMLSVHFGSNFILQFLILSIILGVPLLAFHAALGQTLGAGPVDMWKISPLFQGIGIALLLSQALIGIYSVVGVSWMFVYFRDSFITKQDTYRWAEPFQFYRDDHLFPTFGPNGSQRLEQTVPEYLYGVVLQRNGFGSHENAFGHLKFQLTFNLAVVWMIVFVSLSKGLRSYGKVVYVFSLVPVLGILVLCSKLLGLTPIHRGLFPQTEWSEFFLNAKSWISAATEVMLTWNLLGAATMQVTSHNRATKRLWRDVITIALLTLVVLILAAFLANTCHQILYARGNYGYVPSSFERLQSYTFLRPLHSPLPPSYTIPVRHMPHASLVAGDRVGKPGTIQESGYQVIRLATELVPATLALLGGDYLSPFWAVLFYFTLILFGVAQQLAIWHCVITGIMAINAPSLKSWETTITFFTCAAGFVLGLPMTTELGVFVMYFLDYCIGGGWWVLLLTLVQICAVLMVRGRPFSGENISIALFGKKPNCLSIWAVPMLTFSWNVIMPVALLVVCITIFKSGGYRDLWTWRCTGRDYWPLWAREVGVFIQIIPLLCFPVVAVIQCYRYLSSGPPDIFDRIANLYRPTTETNANTEDNTAQQTVVPPSTTATNGTTDLPPAEDPPPKYTPPPSYSTATGARIAKMLRQSFRRSMRRIQTVLGPDVHIPPRPPPPDYSSVLVEMNQGENATGESLPQPPENNAYTAADVAQLLRCSFRRVHGTRASHSAATNNQTSQNLVIPPQWTS